MFIYEQSVTTAEPFETYNLCMDLTALEVYQIQTALREWEARQQAERDWQRRDDELVNWLTFCVTLMLVLAGVALWMMGR